MLNQAIHFTGVYAFNPPVSLADKLDFYHEGDQYWATQQDRQDIIDLIAEEAKAYRDESIGNRADARSMAILTVELPELYKEMTKRAKHYWDGAIPKAFKTN